jgi:hypothetical protein
MLRASIPWAYDHEVHDFFRISEPDQAVVLSSSGEIDLKIGKLLVRESGIYQTDEGTTINMEEHMLYGGWQIDQVLPYPEAVISRGFADGKYMIAGAPSTQSLTFAQSLTATNGALQIYAKDSEEHHGYFKTLSFQDGLQFSTAHSDALFFGQNMSDGLLISPDTIMQLGYNTTIDFETGNLTGSAGAKWHVTENPTEALGIVNKGYADGRYLRYEAGRAITVNLGTNNLANGTALLAAYATAKTMSPAISNEVTIILPPAIYDLGSSTLNMTSEYINIRGLVPVTLTMQGAVTVVTSGITNTGHSAVLTGEAPKSIIRSSGFAISNKVSNGSVYYAKIEGSVRTADDKTAVWQDVWFTGNVDKELATSNTFIRVYAPLGICGDPAETFSGGNHFRGVLENSVVSGASCLGGGGSVSGTLTGNTITGGTCVGGEGSVTGTFTRNTISGANCVGGSSGTVSGTFTDNTISGNYCVGGNSGTVSGLFDGNTITGNRCVGSYGTVRGTFVRCVLVGPEPLYNATIATNATFAFSTGIPAAVTNVACKVFSCADQNLNSIPNR